MKRSHKHEELQPTKRRRTNLLTKNEIKIFIQNANVQDKMSLFWVIFDSKIMWSELSTDTQQKIVIMMSLA